MRGCHISMDFAERIIDKELTKTEKIIADYILDNINTIGFKPLKEVALACGISDTSVIRFLRELGYDGYTDFKKSLNEKLLEHYNAQLSPLQKFNQSKAYIDTDSVAKQVLYNSVTNLSNAMMNLDDKLLQDIADCLIKSKNKYIAAFRGTSCCADYFWRKAIFFLPGLILCNKAESETIEKMVDITENDCLMLFSFPRYSNICNIILEMAKKRSAKIIIFTDRVTSPLATYADYLVTVNVTGVSFTNSYVVPLCLAEALAVIISKKVENSTDERLNLLEEKINTSNLY